MNFLNSYILIFRRNNINSKRFVSLFFLFVFIILFFSAFLKYLNIDMNTNDLMKNYQLKKLSSSKIKDIDTIIVGDSSSGNAINAQLFSKLSELNTISLSLTGSWGIVGSLGLSKIAYKNNTNIKNIIIIHTLDIWRRPFSNNSIHEFFSLKERFRHLGLKSIISNEINIKEIKWLYEYLLRKIKNKSFSPIDYSNDYLLQKKKKTFKSFSSLSSISQEKIRELKMFDNFCYLQKINCIYLNGPMHEGIINKSNKFFKEYKLVMKNLNIKYINKIFSYKNEVMGDSKDHILPKYKKKVTKEYYEEIKDLLK